MGHIAKKIGFPKTCALQRFIRLALYCVRDGFQVERITGGVSISMFINCVDMPLRMDALETVSGTIRPISVELCNHVIYVSSLSILFRFVFWDGRTGGREITTPDDEEKAAPGLGCLVRDTELAKAVS